MACIFPTTRWRAYSRLTRARRLWPSRGRWTRKCSGCWKQRRPNPFEGDPMTLDNLATALACALILLPAPAYAESAEDRSVRAFKVHVPQAALDDLRRRINATRWPDRETVSDQSQGAQLA